MASQDTTQGASSTNVPVDEPPLWNYVTKIEKQGIRISICKKSTTSDKIEMKRIEESYEEKKAQSKAKEVGLPCEGGVGFKKRSYNQLITALLQNEKENVHRLLEPVRFSWKEKGVTIIDFFIVDLMKEVINEIGHQNIVQIITDNAANCKAAGEIIESQFPHIYWIPHVVHMLNLALKNICSPRYVETNTMSYDECNWIKEVHTDALAIKNFIMNHNMRFLILNKFSSIRLLLVADTRFASIIVMLKRLKLIKRGLQAMVISEEWSSYIEDDSVKANFVKEKIVDDEWWEKVSYILSFIGPIYEMIRLCDTDKPCLHLVYEMWDSMIEKVKIEIYKKEKRRMSEPIPFYDVVHGILQARWTKNNTPLHCLAHSLNPRY
ncbi:uncharacterized protein LOC143616801 [Bidens hawaiensis]|uniref:uncharacterized protein LOC143616801 n=1 Tax=Bidens hawaiensis TaxID=980011 RepID=UPI004049ED6F